MRRVSKFFLMTPLSLALVLISGFGNAVSAQTATDANAPLAGQNYEEAREAQIAQIVRKRQYAGGRDESDLKVQSQMTNPTRKQAPSMEIDSSAGESSSED